MATQTAPRLFDAHQRPLALGAEVGRGGEGTIFAVENDGTLLAKRYHRPPDAQLTNKLTAMVAARTDRLARLAAWPLATVHDKPGGPVVGFLMPKAEGYRPIHHLYSPKSRLSQFPSANWPFLVHVAGNLARVFAVIHEHGHVIGDVNHGNVLVSERGLVKLIDCDSFQVTQGGRRYLCEVGVATHTPPELQDQSFRGVARTPNHDAFGLATLIFQLLFLGRHPFSGTYLGRGEMPLERAIKEARFAYSADSARTQMSRPPGTLPLNAASAPVAALFERAFAPAGSIGGRPRADAWAAALAGLGAQLRACEASGAHHYVRSLAACPWCALERQAGVSFFHWIPVPSLRVEQFDLAAVWAAIAATPAPGGVPPFPEAGPAARCPSTQARRAGRRRRRRQRVAVGVALAFVVIAFVVVANGFLVGAAALVIGLVIAAGIGASGRSAALIKQADAARERAGIAVRDVSRQWARLNDEPYRALLRDLEAKKAQYEHLPIRRARALQQSDADQRARQLTRFLDAHRLDDAFIQQVGPARLAVLQSHGIETAADISQGRLAPVRGFGPALVGGLLDWRRTVERQFVYRPNLATPLAEIAAIEREIAAERMRLERELRAGEDALRRLAARINEERRKLRPVAIYAAEMAAQAEAERAAL